MNKNEQDIETIRYNYVALKKLHLIANATNKDLNLLNTKLQHELINLKIQITDVQKANLSKQEMITSAYTKLNDLQNGYNQTIHVLHTKTQELQQKLKDLANGNNIN